MEMYLLIASLCYVNITLFASGCTPGDVRLVGGENQYGGRVDYCSSRIWKPVCSGIHEWTDFEAGLICNAIGLPGIINATAQSCVTVRSNSGGLAFDCNETVANITECYSSAVSGTCSSAMATCIVKNSCAHLNCFNNSTCTEEGYDPSKCPPNECTCNDHWTGKNCDQALCDPPCADGGNCTAPNTCQNPDGTQGTQSDPGDSTFSDLSPTLPGTTHNTNLSKGDAGTDYTIIIGALSSAGTLLGIAVLAVTVTIVQLTFRKRKRTRQADYNVETPPTDRTDSVIIGSTSRQLTTTAFIPTAPQFAIIQEAITPERHNENSREPWIYEDASSPQRETVQSAMYQSLECLNHEMSNGYSASPAQEELQPTGHTDVLVPRYMEFGGLEENMWTTHQMETVESELYQSIEELRY